MIESRDSKSVSALFADERAVEWMEEHLPELRQSLGGQRFLYWSLAISLVAGLAAHVGGYVLLSSAPKGPLGLLADLLHAFGWSLWTGAVVAVFVQVIPEAKRRQIKRALDAYEALQREKDLAVETRAGAVPKRPGGGPPGSRARSASGRAHERAGKSSLSSKPGRSSRSR